MRLIILMILWSTGTSKHSILNNEEMIKTFWRKLMVNLRLFYFSRIFQTR